MQTENETRKAFLRLLGPLTDRPALAAGAAGTLVAELACSLANPVILGRAFDAAASGRSLTRWAALFLAASAGANVLRYLGSSLRGRLTHSALAALRERALEKLHRLSPGYFGAQDSGAVLARVSRDVEKIRPLYGEVLPTSLRLSLVGLGSLGVMLWASPALAAVTLSCLAASLALTLHTAERLAVLDRKADDLYDGVSLDIKESVEGVRVVKAFGREDTRRRRFKERVDGYLGATLASSGLWSVRIPMANALFALATPAILLVGGAEVAAGRAEKGAVVACLFYAARLVAELGGLARLVSTAQESAISGSRLFELFDSVHMVAEPKAPRALPAGRGELRFENVSFGYPGAPRLLSGVTFSVAPGERVAVVGATGTGKSTLAALLLRFFDPSEGRILLDGADLSELPVSELRRAVACVFQESFLFSGTLRRNISFARPEATELEVLAAAETAQLGPVLAALPKGLDTMVGERGVTLSGGQRQRAALARAVLAGPRLLILDDATASVDAGTERELVRALAAAARERTTLVITQRLSGVLLADRVVVLGEGRVLDEGRHVELLERCAAYRALFWDQAVGAAV